MAQSDRFLFSFREVATNLVRAQGIHEGHWGLYMEFAIQGMNVPGSGGDLHPAALVPIMKLGIQLFPEPNTLTVDAAEVNPAPPPAPPAVSHNPRGH